MDNVHKKNEIIMVSVIQSDFHLMHHKGTGKFLQSKSKVKSKKPHYKYVGSYFERFAKPTNFLELNCSYKRKGIVSCFSCHSHSQSDLCKVYSVPMYKTNR